MQPAVWKILVPLLFTASLAGAVNFTEDFSTNPLAHGWRIFGDTNLFSWNSTNQNLEVTWDSSQTNSYFYHPLGTILTTNDDFSLEFDLRLNDANITGHGFEIAVGLLNFNDATGQNFLRGTGRNAPNLAEFDYFPDFGFGPTVSATAVDNGGANFIFNYDDTLALEDGIMYHIVLTHAAGTAAISGLILTNGQLCSSFPFSYSTLQFLGFRVDTLSVSSFNGAHSGGSILAYGVVDNLVATVPAPPVQNLSGCLTNGLWQTQFQSQPGWMFTLQRSADFKSWTNVSPPVYCAVANFVLQDSNPPANQAFYRVEAERP